MHKSPAQGIDFDPLISSPNRRQCLWTGASVRHRVCNRFISELLPATSRSLFMHDFCFLPFAAAMLAVTTRLVASGSADRTTGSAIDAADRSIPVSDLSHEGGSPGTQFDGPASQASRLGDRTVTSTLWSGVRQVVRSDGNGSARPASWSCCAIIKPTGCVPPAKYSKEGNSRGIGNWNYNFAVSAHSATQTSKNN